MGKAHVAADILNTAHTIGKEIGRALVYTFGAGYVTDVTRLSSVEKNSLTGRELEIRFFKS